MKFNPARNVIIKEFTEIQKDLIKEVESSSRDFDRINQLAKQYGELLEASDFLSEATMMKPEDLYEKYNIVIAEGS